jgi:hypothetical protein
MFRRPVDDETKLTGDETISGGGEDKWKPALATKALTKWAATAE